MIGLEHVNHGAVAQTIKYQKSLLDLEKMAILLAHHLAVEKKSTFWNNFCQEISLNPWSWENLSHLEIVGFKCYKTRVLKSKFDNQEDWRLQITRDWAMHIQGITSHIIETDNGQ